MLKYKKSRQPDKLDIIIDGMKVMPKSPAIQLVAYHLVEYIDTVRFIPKHLNLNQHAEQLVSNVIVQSFAELFKKIVSLDWKPMRIVDEVALLTSTQMLPKMHAILHQNTVATPEQIQEACQLFIPPALLKLRSSLGADLSG
jgi:hypothetical protein